MQLEKDRVVLDTNVVISAAVSIEGAPAKVFEKLLKKEIINFTTEEIIEEIETVFERPSIKECAKDDIKSFIINNFRTLSIMIKPPFDEKAVKDDISDNKFINCALSAKAHIISGDKHLLDLKEYKGVKIYSVNEFLNK